MSNNTKVKATKVKGTEKQTRIVMTENEALAILNRNRIKIEYPKILLPKTGPGLKCWAAIDCLTNRTKPKYILISRGGKA